MNRYLLDTNHLGDTIRRVSVVRDRIQQSVRRGDVFGVCGPVLCELQVGLVSRSDYQVCRKRLDRLLHAIRVWPIDIAIAEEYAKVYHELRLAGRALSQTDITLAARGRHWKATVLTTDNDFEAVKGLRVENWLIPDV